MFVDKLSGCRFESRCSHLNTTILIHKQWQTWCPIALGGHTSLECMWSNLTVPYVATVFNLLLKVRELMNLQSFNTFIKPNVVSIINENISRVIDFRKVWSPIFCKKQSRTSHPHISMLEISQVLWLYNVLCANSPYKDEVLLRYQNRNC